MTFCSAAGNLEDRSFRLSYRCCLVTMVIVRFCILMVAAIIAKEVRVELVVIGAGSSWSRRWDALKVDNLLLNVAM